MKYLIFDCGGVIVYPRLGDWCLPFRAAELLGDRAKDLYSSKYVLAHRASAQWLDEGRLVSSIEMERRLRWQYIESIGIYMGWRLTPEEIQRLADDFTDNINRYGFFEDVTPWLRRWKERYHLGMLSDAMPSILNFMDQYGILELFDAAVISTQIGALKPSERMYQAILEALEAPPEECLFVDDKVGNLEGAMAAGMRAVQMARPNFLPEKLWDGPVVGSFEALNRWLEA